MILMIRQGWETHIDWMRLHITDCFLLVCPSLRGWREKSCHWNSFAMTYLKGYISIPFQHWLKQIINHSHPSTFLLAQILFCFVLCWDSKERKLKRCSYSKTKQETKSWGLLLKINNSFSPFLMLSSDQFSRSVVSYPLWPHESQHASLPCPSPTHGVTLTHVLCVGDAIQPSHPLPSPSPTLNLSQHQGLFKWVNSLHQVAKVLESQRQHQSFQWTPRTDVL